MRVEDVRSGKSGHFFVPERMRDVWRLGRDRNREEESEIKLASARSRLPRSQTQCSVGWMDGRKPSVEPTACAFLIPQRALSPAVAD